MYEGELLRSVAQGDRAAFDEFYRRTAPWLTVWRAAGSFVRAGVDGSALGWLWTIAARRLVDAFRRRARDAQALGVIIEDSTRDVAGIGVGWGAAVPAAEDTLLDQTIGDPLWTALHRLAPSCPRSCRPWCSMG
jgi:RNA polymerase sigma-70 factor (ECF subfamily)